ncbi:hypothetical protein AAFC00_004452 [Neodothiora populina]|uniref:Uncharacterized protein n=1 Tax=Neodothiora populina TaxID=2781224 RepID=A0ABR3P2V4_9PEZI
MADTQWVNTKDLPGQRSARKRSLPMPDSINVATQASHNKRRKPLTGRLGEIVKGQPKPEPMGDNYIDLTGDDDRGDVYAATASGKHKTPKQVKSDGEEKRLKRHRDKLPQAASITLERALTQRMYIVDRKRYTSMLHCPHNTPDCPEETVDLAGTTGNVYTVTITHVPRCTCPNFQKGNSQCKHILYVLVKVLKAPVHLQYQLAFLTSELREIFGHAGPMPTETASASDTDGKRKPIEGDCPICVEEIDSSGGGEAIIWCRAACGNNLHKSCFEQWAASRRGHGDKITCPYCRTVWAGSIDAQAVKNLDKSGAVNEDGYVNIAAQLGITGRRDFSSYNPYWVRQQRRAGVVDEDQTGYLAEY